MATTSTRTAATAKKPAAKKTATPKVTAAKKPAAKKATAAKPAVKKAATAKAAPKATKPKMPLTTAPSPIGGGLGRGSARKTTAPSPEQRYRMIQEAAYFIAEKNGFAAGSTDYWIMAEAQIEAMMSDRK